MARINFTASDLSKHGYGSQEDRALVESLVSINARCFKIGKGQLALMKDLNNVMNRFLRPISKRVKRRIDLATLNESCDIILYILNYLRYTIGLSGKIPRKTKVLDMITKIEHTFSKLCMSSLRSYSYHCCIYKDETVVQDRMSTIASYCKYLHIKIQFPNHVRVRFIFVNVNSYFSLLVVIIHLGPIYTASVQNTY